MPRAYCPECGSEVPVDADGICHVGHRVTVGSDPVADAPTIGGDEADEPQPWVASVDSTTLGGFTPPPGAPEGVPDEQPWTPPADDADGGDELAAAAAAAIESLDAEAASEPTPADPPASTGPVDDPAEDFDLDDLAAAVSDLGMDDDPTPAADAGPAPASDTPAPAPEAPAPVADAPAADQPPAGIDWDDELGDPGGRGDAGAEVGADADVTSDRAPDEVDLSNFTAKGGRVRTGGAGGGKGGLFRRR